MPINPIMFILGRQLAANHRVSAGQANTDGLLAAVMRPAALGLALAAVLSENQEPAAAPPAIPTIQRVSPAFGPVGINVTILGSNFGPKDGNAAVTFGGAPATNIVVVDPQTITAVVPGAAPAQNTDVNVVVTVGNVASQPGIFTLTPTPNG